jgi:hypothetical protein
MAKHADTVATTFKDKKPAKIVSHLEVHPNMDGGHNVEIHHTHSFDHPAEVKEFSGPHEEVSLPKGHILHHIAKNLGISIAPTGVAAGDEENVSAKESAET